jgi:hypothetical protein
MRKYGLTVHNLLSVEMVTADGESVAAGAAENSDLFWGVRGGGGNFGIVTNLRRQSCHTRRRSEGEQPTSTSSSYRPRNRHESDCGFPKGQGQAQPAGTPSARAIPPPAPAAARSAGELARGGPHAMPHGSARPTARPGTRCAGRRIPATRRDHRRQLVRGDHRNMSLQTIPESEDDPEAGLR